MELNGYRLLLPEGTLDYFDLVDVKESVNEVVFYLEEKNMVPEKYTDCLLYTSGLYLSWAYEICVALTLVREDRVGLTSGLPVVPPGALPVSYTHLNERNPYG